MITDQQFVEFLNLLAADVRGKNGIILTAWESDFVNTFCHLPNGAFHFTDPRRQAVDRMWRRYGAELNHPHPLDRVAERPAIPAADAGGCEYLVKGDDGRQHRCNEPATCREPGRLRYCEMHGAAVKRACPKIALVDFLTTDGHG